MEVFLYFFLDKLTYIKKAHSHKNKLTASLKKLLKLNYLTIFLATDQVIFGTCLVFLYLSEKGSRERKTLIN